MVGSVFDIDIHTTRNCLLSFTLSTGSFVLLHKHPSVIVLFRLRNRPYLVRLIFQVKLEKFAIASVIPTVQVFYFFNLFS